MGNYGSSVNATMNEYPDTTRLSQEMVEDEAGYRDLGRATFFRDGKRKIDYVLAYEPSTLNEVQQKNRAGKREEFEKNLRKYGLELEREDIENSSDGKTIFIKVHVPWSTMLDFAEEMKMKMPLKENDIDNPTLRQRCFAKLCCCKNPFALDENDVPKQLDCYTCAFRKDRQNQFLFPPNKEDFFTRVQRTRVAHRILMKCRYDDRKHYQMGVARLVANGTYTAAYPIHEGPAKLDESKIDQTITNDRQRLYYHWAKPNRWFKEQPLDLIRQYFGEKIGLYFVWIGFYTAFLVPAAIVGVFVIIYGLFSMNDYQPIQDLCHSNTNLPMCPRCDAKCDYTNLVDSCIYTKLTYLIDNPFTVVFAVFMSLWATFFLEFWKRKQAGVQYDWDLKGFEDEEERPRPEFEAKVTTMAVNPITRLEEPYLGRGYLCLRYTVAFNCMLMMICVVVIAIMSVVTYRMAVYAGIAASSSLDITWVSLIASSTAAMLNLIAIMLLNKLYERVAMFLTEWELPKTQTLFDNLFTFKMYVFQFVNFYGSLFYIAFFKLNPGSPRKYNRIFGFRREECNPAGCLFELGIQLFVIMVGKQIMNNFVEILIPKFKSWRRKKDNIEEDHLLTQWEQDYDLVENDPRGILFYEYLEMVIQFGFITIFVSAFPLGPLFAMLNNLIEIRVDAYKLVSILQRPFGERVESIGIWQEILTAIAKISVVVNAFVIAFLSEFIPRLYYQHIVSPDGGMDGYLNFTLSCFDINDFNGTQAQPNFPFKFPANSCGFGKQTCRYHGFYEPPYTTFNGTMVKNPHAYQLGTNHWYVTAVRFAFVIGFEHLVFLLVSILAWLIPDLPKALELQMKREIYVGKEALRVGGREDETLRVGGREDNSFEDIPDIHMVV